MKVSVIEYCPQWREMFQEERQSLRSVLDKASAEIEHIGSTSVNGLAAKPVIDIMVGLPDFSMAEELVPEIKALGYEYFRKYEVEIPYRRYFAKNLNRMRTHQIHMVEIGGDFWERHLFFRDYLRQNPDAADRYAALKKIWQSVNGQM